MRQIARQPAFAVAVLAGMVGYGVMNLLMTAAPLSMHRFDGHSLDDAAGVIGAHVVAMYLPSLVSGYLIERFGAIRMMGVGTLTLVGTVLVGLAGREFAHYWGSMVVLGVGWNFLYVGGTTLLVRTYRESERFKAQSVNEFCVFGTTAVTSLLSGTLIHFFGWDVLLYTAAPVIAAMGLALFAIRRDPLAGRVRSPAVEAPAEAPAIPVREIARR